MAAGPSLWSLPALHLPSCLGRLLKMPRNQIREYLQVTLKQTWNLDNNVVIKKLQASKRDLVKRQCLLLPSEGVLCLGLWSASLLGGVSAVGGPSCGNFYFILTPLVFLCCSALLDKLLITRPGWASGSFQYGHLGRVQW